MVQESLNEPTRGKRKVEMFCSNSDGLSARARFISLAAFVFSSPLKCLRCCIMHGGPRGVICTADNDRVSLPLLLLIGVQRDNCFTKSDLQFHSVRAVRSESNYKLYLQHKHMQNIYTQGYL